MPYPRHIEEAEYRARAMAAAMRAARRNGVEIRASDVTFPGSGFASTRVTCGWVGKRYRQGEPMRLDVALAVDRMAATRQGSSQHLE